MMESNYGDSTRTQAAEALVTLSADRQRLARRVQVPWALMAGFGALGAWWVGSAWSTNPGAGYEPPQTGWIALLGVLVVCHLVQREMGLRFRSLGARANLAIAGIVVSCLALFSISLGLASLQLQWAVIMTSLTAFALTTWLAGIACRSAVENLGRD
ncbi:hypothetical protein [Kocuria carniphila]|uniref:hypothetical protein n=1 Tax=Kocuria carniphila TaxID=262208 RepID=UPI0028ED63A6|nr:hypothetical protein [Kocuria carniphila]